ncbi:reverse transcriptase domain-containing protein [Tanacetum coccineum]
MEKIFQIFQDLRFDISFVDALLLMPRFAPTIKSLLMNKEKLLELAKIPLNENCSAMLLKKLPEKLGDPGKFLIPCNFSRMDVCHSLANLGASINLMPLSIWKKLSLPDLTPTRMTLELADRSIRALIDVYEGELVLRDGNEQITFHVNGTSKHPQKHENESIKMVNDACKDSFNRYTNEPALVCLTPPEDVNNEKEKQEVKNLAEPTVQRQTRFSHNGDEHPENLAADHLSRLENPHKDVLENKDINETFPLETLGVISSENTPWFAGYANFHAGNFIIKGMMT